MADPTIKMSKVESLDYYARNSRTHSDEQVAQIAASIREFGFTNPVLIDGKGIIIAGHGRIMAARKLGLEKVPTIALTHLTEAQQRALVIADNKLALNAGWDEEMLKVEMAELKELDFDLEIIGFDAEELADLFAVEPEAGLTDPDAVPEPPEKLATFVGDVWQLGNHRLICGDSTDVTVIEKLMDGQLADMWLTDPPYNVAYEGKTKDALKIQNDEMKDDDFRLFLSNSYNAASAVMKAGAVFYIWHADSEGYNFRGAAADVGWQVRQCLIWKKQQMVLGRQDYHWMHEPCQPPGTMVTTPTGLVPIEHLHTGDSVVSFDKHSGQIVGKRDGFEVTVGSRQYDGDLYGVKVGSKTTRTTDSHRFSVRFNPEMKAEYCTYLMKRGDWWRLGYTRTYDARGFGLKQRFRQEKPDAAWILDVYDNKDDALLAETILSIKHGIPMTHWETERGFKRAPTRSAESIYKIYESLDLEKMRQNAESLLSEFNRRADMPLLIKENMTNKFSTRVTVQISACNLIHDLMQVPIPTEGSHFIWTSIDAVTTEPYSGPVYSMDVDKYEHYIADGIVTHNCLYGWKDGAAHLWATDRKQTTILEFDRPSANKEHPTMKPVALFEYQVLNNTKGQDIVLDSFGGSGTTVIVCEKNGRHARVCELDPVYAEVIIKRFQEFTGTQATLVETGQTYDEVRAERVKDQSDG